MRRVFVFGLSFIARPLLAAPSASLGLRPQYDELQPTLWEQHGWLIVISSVCAILIISLLVFLLRRGQQKNIEPPYIVARRALETLRGRTEDGFLIMQVSQTLRRYVIVALDLAPGELTTTELSASLQSKPDLSPPLTDAINNFLRQCDERKFAPVVPPAPASVVGRALELLEQVHQHQQRLHANQPQTSKTPASPSAA